ncbi:hypothetical protein [Halomontanus rarus]|uniref:hypothetical protein n=1 Tax=Halomontanus rarus TaxID=3034020 RepID=UPI0023E75C5D|nr:hypothetical protein [Halovivax sp. TS33]
MYESNLFKRLWELGLRSFILSYDFIAAVITFAVIYSYTGGGFPSENASPILTSFTSVSAGLFAIVLTGFTIITSFTDRMFLYAWKKVGEFENIVTTFQYNLILPVLVLLGALALQIQYHELGMLLLITLFVYMLFSLLDLVGLISRYALQRGEFVKQQVETEQSNQAHDPTDSMSRDDLLRIYEKLNELEYQKEQQETREEETEKT